MDDWSRQFLLNSGVLDTETLSREAGSGFTEIAYYNFSENKVTEFLPRPQTVEITNNIQQDQTNLRSKSNFKYTSKNHNNWKSAIVDMLVREYKLEASKLVTDREIRDALSVTNTFLYKQLYSEEGSAHPHVMGNFPTPSEVAARAALFEKAGIKYELGGSNITMEEIMGMKGPLRTAITSAADPTRGTTVWIANAVFEAKQFGATLGAMNEVDPGYADKWKQMLETRSQFPEPFYVTGKEVTRARTTAQTTGDYTVLWKAYKESVPKAGEVAVRDIQDLTRALLSYGKKYGLIDIEAKQLTGVGIDYQERLLRGSFLSSQEARESGLTSAEAHRAAEDAAKSESFVLRKKIESLRAFDLLEDGGEAGRRAIEEARKGQGPLSPVLRYFEMYNASIGPALKKRHLLQQFERGIGDIESKGYATHTNGINEVVSMSQNTPSGVPTETYRVEHAYTFQKSEQEYFDEIVRRGEFAAFDVDAKAEWDDMQKFIQEETLARQANPSLRQLTRKELAGLHVENKTGDAVSSYFAENAKRMMQMNGMKLAGRMKSRWAPMGLSHFVGHGMTKAGMQLNTLGSRIMKNTPRAGMVMGALALTGLMSNAVMQENNVGELDNSKSILTMDYGEYEALRNSQQEGFAESGFAKATRAMNTDFGSPYQGPTTSFDVLVNQELLREREKLNRIKFNARHDSDSGLFFPFSNPFRRNSVLNGRKPDEGELRGLRGTENMRVLDVGEDWAMEVEDVDTVMVKKRGFFGGVQRFFGLGGSHTFRLEGIDSTEISHGMFDDSWHTPQPGAVEAIEGMKKLASVGELKIAYDPKDSTYGRAVGTVFAGGSNINLKAVERGLAAHLPYGSYKDAHADWDAYRAAEDKAYGAKRGLWGTPWAQVYKEFSNSAGTQITFNTFARKDRMAENYETMKLISVMEHAQENGGASLLELESAKHIGKSWNKFGDTIKPYRMEGNTAANYRTYIGNLMQDNTNFIETRGTGSNPNKNASSNMSELNNYLAVDSLGTTNSIYSKRSFEAYKIYGADKALKRERKEKMAAMQRHISSQFGNSPVNHHRM